MLKILQIADNIDNSLKLDPSQLTGDAVVDMKSTYVRGFQAGLAATIGSNGFAKISGAADSVLGLIVNDAEGFAHENTPAIASGIVPVLTGGLVWSDQVAGDVQSGAKVYVVDGGKVSATAPSADAIPFGICTEGNAATDGPITFRFGTKF